MDKYLPYIVSILTAIISGFVSCMIARKQAKTELQKLEKQHMLDIEKERELFSMEKEKMELDHRHQLEVLQAQFGNQLGADFISMLTKEYVRLPAGQAQLKNAGQRKRK